jgi:hypothetical protein
LNIITFVLYVLKGGSENSRELFTYKNVFVASIILTAVTILYFGVVESWKIGREFIIKKQYVLLAGQILITMAIVYIGSMVVLNLVKFIFN